MSHTAPNANYRQIVALALAPAIGLGLARFAYALLLPSMKDNLGWNFSEAGWMNTANAIGYLLGALLVSRLANLFGLWRLLQLGVVCTTATLVLTGFTEHFWALTLLRFNAGVFGAFCLAAGGTVAAVVALNFGHRANTALLLFYIGPGIGITLSGLIVPGYVAHFGDAAWSSAWWVIGGIATVLCVLFFKSPAPVLPPKATDLERAQKVAWLTMAPILIGYTAMGAGYIGYMTFVFAYLQISGASTLMLSLFWATIGVSAIAAPWIWQRAKLTERGAIAFAVLTFISLVGATVPLISTSTLSLFASAAIFGSAFFSATAQTTAFAKRNSTAAQWPTVIGVFTVAFGLGQVIGPIMTGAISDKSGSLFQGLAWGCALLLFGALISLFQRSPNIHQTVPDSRYV